MSFKRRQPSQFTLSDHSQTAVSGIRRRSGTHVRKPVPAGLESSANGGSKPVKTGSSGQTRRSTSVKFSPPSAGHSPYSTCADGHTSISFSDLERPRPPCEASSSQSHERPTLNVLVEESAYSTVPLTPLLDHQASDMSSSSAGTGHFRAGVSRLPTPDYSMDYRSHISGRRSQFSDAADESAYDQGDTLGLSRSNTIRSFMARGWEFVRLPLRQYPPQASFASMERCGIPASVYGPNSPSNSSNNIQGKTATLLSSSSAASSRISVAASSDCGRSSLIPSIGTTEKFTHKWPRPKVPISTHSWSAEHSMDPRTSQIFMALEDEQGLGIERIDRWTMFKWFLLLSILTLLMYGTAVLVAVILTWFRTWPLADVMFVADYDLLVLSTLGAALLLFTAMVGLTGTILNSRPILAIYGLLLWPAFVSILVVGYISYKRSTFALDRKLGHAWSTYYTPLGRLMLQNSLKCCGFLNALHEATPSGRCYPRAPLPGCKGPLLRFEKANLDFVWGVAFSLVPLHIITIVVALLCANHVTNRFGKGITPKGYRLTAEDVQRDADEIRKMGVGKGVAMIKPCILKLKGEPSVVSVQ